MIYFNNSQSNSSINSRVKEQVLASQKVMRQKAQTEIKRLEARLAVLESEKNRSLREKVRVGGEERSEEYKIDNLKKELEKIEREKRKIESEIHELERQKALSEKRVSVQKGNTKVLEGEILELKSKIQKLKDALSK